MRIYFSGIGGVGIGPLAQIALDAGYEVLGSDREASLVTDQLQRNGVQVYIGEQTGEALQAEHARTPFDYFVYTAALSSDHPELASARQLGISCLKRDGLLARIISEKNLSMIAVAGTHGKTTTTSLLVWVMLQLGIPISYSVGSTLSFAPSGAYHPESQHFVYECDEYDRNFLHFTPRLSLITSLGYDHPDTYPTLESYQQAFAAFIDQSDNALLWHKDHQALDSPDYTSDATLIDETTTHLEHIQLPGVHLRQNAFLVERAIRQLFPEVFYHDLITAINSFPGTTRRFEKLGDNLYSDYGHHPTEIAATLQLASEVSAEVVLVYQPHQNVRQHKVQSEYNDEIFAAAKLVYWLPTYLSREDPTLPTLTPQQLTAQLQRDGLYFAELDDNLWDEINRHRSAGRLVLCMGAGSIDGWLRTQLDGQSLN